MKFLYHSKKRGIEYWFNFCWPKIGRAKNQIPNEPEKMTEKVYAYFPSEFQFFKYWIDGFEPEYDLTLKLFGFGVEVAINKVPKHYPTPPKHHFLIRCFNWIVRGIDWEDC